MKPIEHYWRSINLVSVLLLPLAVLFCGLAMARKAFYRFSLLKSYKAPVPVLVVGNISVGGTGKTPLIIELVKQLQQSGYKPGVISRGYGGQSTSWPQQLDEHSTPQQVGDEPVLIYQHTAAPMVVGPDRRQDIELLLSTAECDLILSDDGLQHYALRRNAEIAVVDAQRLFGNRLCLPAGPLREPVRRLKQVDLTLYNGAGISDDSFLLHTAECMSVCDTGTKKLLEDFSNTTVHAVAGIGHPQRFFSMLEEAGINVIAHAFPDHHDYSSKDVSFADDLPVLMTEKDAVKCRDFNLDMLWSVPVQLKLTESAQRKLDTLIDSLFK